MGYAKIFDTLFESSVWVGSKPYVKLAWITLLAKSDANGRVETPIPGLAKAAEITTAEFLEALDVFMAPDPFSRDKELEGRRVSQMDDGSLLVLNYPKYREKRGECSSRVHVRSSAHSNRSNLDQDNADTATTDDGMGRYDSRTTDHRLECCESHPERLLGSALYDAIPDHEVLPQYVVKCDGSRYRLDFAVIREAGYMKVAVEVDGHEFHEKTPEQAARDRTRSNALEINGWRVLRFTGSQVFRDPAGCAAQVVRMLNSFSG